MVNKKLIAIAGKRNSGKDTVGEILQYLHSELYIKYKYSFEAWKQKEKESNLNGYTNYKIVKFADRLKEVTAKMIGCQVSKLECRVFKESPLPDSWWYYILRDGTRVGYSNITVIDSSKIQELVKTTPRDIMVSLGTEWRDSEMFPELWGNLTLDKYPIVINQFTGGNYIKWCKSCKERFHNADRYQDYCKDCTKKGIEIYPKWIITDLRFEKEAKLIENLKGFNIRVNSNRSDIVNHISETELDSYGKFHWEFDNIGTIEYLIDQVKFFKNQILD